MHPIWLLLAACTSSSTTADTRPAAADTNVTADTDTDTDSTPVVCAEFDAPETTGSVVDDAITEISGIVASRTHPGVLWIHEDSGAAAQLTALDETGQTLAVITLDGVSNRDWEDLATGPCGEETCLFVGEIGDNAEVHDAISVLRLPEPDPTIGDQTVTATRFDAQYPGGSRDAEAMMVTPEGLPVVITKDEETEVYAYPSLDAENTVTLTAMGRLDTVAGDSFSMGDQVTAADLSPNGLQLAVRTYTRIWLFDVTAGMDAATNRQSVDSKAEMQGESLGYDSDGLGLWHVSEGKYAKLYHLRCGSF